MKSLRVSAAAVSLLALSLAGSTVNAEDRTPTNITVSFGTGNNNAQPGNTPNHHVLPQQFRVRISEARKLDGTVVVVPATVNFTVAGFHWPWVYRDGVTLEEVAAHVPAAGTFVNYEVITAGVSNVFAKGVFPGTPPAFADITPASPTLSAAQNRNDSFAFSTPGTYLVICNVRGHFIDGMYAWINVVDDDDDN
jgi:plastocyanin